MRAAETANDERSESWIPATASPLGRRKTLALARCGAVESCKVGRRVLIRRASLDAFLERARRGEQSDTVDDEDLFGAAS
jgi:excisionase family DNA binding protein